MIRSLAVVGWFGVVTLAFFGPYWGGIRSPEMLAPAYGVVLLGGLARLVWLRRRGGAVEERNESCGE